MAGKADIVNHLVENVEGLTKKQAGEAFDATFNAITDLLNDGERINVSGFGSFSVNDRPARKGRNPATGKPLDIPARRVAKFKEGKELKETLNP